jgi:hypothetical protein
MIGSLPNIRTRCVLSFTPQPQSLHFLFQSVEEEGAAVGGRHVPGDGHGPRPQVPEARH